MISLFHRSLTEYMQDLSLRSLWRSPVSYTHLDVYKRQTGNRVACLSYGPKHVIMIVGMNKVVNDVEDGIKRVRNFASPPNTLRLGLKTPCSMTGRCGDCYGDTCICSQIVVTRRQSAMMKDRVKVILVGESLGY